MNKKKSVLISLGKCVNHIGDYHSVSMYKIEWQRCSHNSHQHQPPPPSYSRQGSITHLCDTQFDLNRGST